MTQETITVWFVDESDQSKRYALDEGELLIGRGSACQIRLLDPKVSRTHARVLQHGGEIIIEDLKSAHGLWVNGNKVDRATLHDGDRVQFGGTVLQVEVPQDQVGMVLPSLDAIDHEGEVCRYCGSPMGLGEAYCTTCGLTARELPEPFGFIQQAFLQLRALYQARRMDASTFRTELEKMIVSDGSGGYWMIGLQSGRWYWFNGYEWVQREPPTTPLKQAPLGAAQPAPPTPVSAPLELSKTEIEESQKSRRTFLIAGGTIVAFSILAIGAYVAYQLVNQNGEAPAEAVELQSPSDRSIAEPLTTETAMETISETPMLTPTPVQEALAAEAQMLPYSTRPYAPDTDESLSNLPDLVEFIEAISSPEHAVYQGTWYVQQRGIFSIGWCAIDEATLNENLQIIQMGLEVDGDIVAPDSMFVEEFTDTDLACRSSRITLEFHEPGEHRLLWTTQYSEPVFDGWQTLEAGTYLNEYVFDVKNVTAIEDEFNESSGKWDESVQQNFSLWIENGSFHIQVHKENFAAWSVYHDLVVEDTLILAHARRVSEVDGVYGLVFRYQDVSNFYYFLIDDSGVFSLGKREAGEWIDLIPWTFSDAVLAGESFNRLGVTATGNELVAYINSEPVGTVTDPSFSKGGVGLIAQSNVDEGGMHAEFEVFYLESYE